MPHFGEIQSLDDLIDVLLTALADGEVLTYDAATGQWINQAPPQPATKEVWVPATIGTDGASQSKVGYHGGYLLDDDFESVHTELHIPHDLTTITEFVAVIIAKATLTPMTVNVRIDAGADGEDYGTHTGAAIISENVTLNRIHELDISGVTAGISADDYVGVELIRMMGRNTNCLVLGVRLKYT